jgi:hypothetical protein
MSTIYTYDAWAEEFKPKPNHLRDQTDNLELPYETYGEEVEFVRLQDPRTIWTEVDGDSGTYIIAGMHWVNRIHYYITEKPWTDEWTEVPTWVYEICTCTDENEDGEYDEACTKCDEGTIDVPCETVEDLKKIYGVDASIVA